MQDSSNESLLQALDSNQMHNAWIGLLCGLVLLCLAANWVRTGKVWVGIHGWVYRTEEPNGFLWQVLMYFIGAAILIGYFIFCICQAAAA